MKIAVVLHLYYHDLWEEFSSALKNFGEIPFDLYVTLVNGSCSPAQQQLMRKKITAGFPNAVVFMAENKGLDIGSFLQVINYFYSFGKEYDLILKLHSKKSIHSCGAQQGESWRQELYQPLLENVAGLLNFLEKNQQIGMVGSKRHIYDYEGVNCPAIYDLESLLSLQTPQRFFIGGTMFWIRHSALKAYLNPENIAAISSKLETGYFTDDKVPRYTHAMERIFGYMISGQQKEIAGI